MRRAAHPAHVVEHVRGRDRAEVARVVDERREVVDREDERALVVELVDRGVIRRRESDQEILRLDRHEAGEQFLLPGRLDEMEGLAAIHLLDGEDIADPVDGDGAAGLRAPGDEEIAHLLVGIGEREPAQAAPPSAEHDPSSTTPPLPPREGNSRGRSRWRARRGRLPLSPARPRPRRLPERVRPGLPARANPLPA